MAENKFQKAAESIFSPIGGAIRGTLRGLDPGSAEAHDIKKQREKAYAEYYGSGATDMRLRMSALSSALKAAGVDPQFGLTISTPDQLAVFRHTLTEMGYPDLADSYEMLMQQQMAPAPTETGAPTEGQEPQSKGSFLDRRLGAKAPALVGASDYAKQRVAEKAKPKAPLASHFVPKMQMGHSFAPGAQEQEDVDAAAARIWGPDYDLSDAILGGKNRLAALMEPGTPVMDTGDGIQTTPKRLADIGINDAEMAQEFDTLEAMVGKAMPEFDLRSDFQANTEFYVRLFKAIREGVPDPKNPGSMRKLSTREIIDLILFDQSRQANAASGLTSELRLLEELEKSGQLGSAGKQMGKFMLNPVGESVKQGVRGIRKYRE